MDKKQIAPRRHKAVIDVVAHGIVGRDRRRIAAIDLPVIDHHAVLPELIEVRIHGDHGVDLPGELRGQELLRILVRVPRQLAAELGGVGHLDFRKAAGVAPDVLLPADGKDRLVQIIQDRRLIAEMSLRVKVELTRLQKAHLLRPLCHLKDLRRILNGNATVILRIGDRADRCSLRDHIGSLRQSQTAEGKAQNKAEEGGSNSTQAFVFSDLSEHRSSPLFYLWYAKLPVLSSAERTEDPGRLPKLSLLHKGRKAEAHRACLQSSGALVGQRGAVEPAAHADASLR